MAELMAIVLTFDGAVGSVSEVVDGHYTGRPGGPFTYREGKAEAIRELAAREDIDLAASWAYSDSESDLPMLRLVGHPVAVNPDAELGRVARAEGWEVCASSGSAGGCASPAPRPCAAALGGLGSVVPRRRSAPPRRRANVALRCAADEPARAHPRAARDPRPRRALRRRADRAARRGVGPEHTFPRELFAELGELGLMGVCVPGGARRRGRGLPRLRARAGGALARRRRRRRDRRRAHERLHAAAARPRRRARGCPRSRRARSSAPSR